MNDRPHDDALLALLYDELSPAEAAALREKLEAESPESLERLAQWQAIRNVVAELPELEPDPQIHYDIIREARKAADAASKPSGIWAWLEQLTLTPALAGLLLVVLAAGLTLRMTTDLEQADDTALAPEPASTVQQPATGKKAPATKKAAQAKREASKTALDGSGGELSPGAAAVPPPVTANAPAEPQPLEQREAQWNAGADPAAEAGALDAEQRGAYGAGNDYAAGLADEKAASKAMEPAPAVKAEKGDGARAGVIDGVEAPVKEKSKVAAEGKAEEDQRASRRSKKPSARKAPPKKQRSKRPKGKAAVGDLLDDLSAPPEPPQAPPATPSDVGGAAEMAKDVTTRGGDAAEPVRRNDDAPLGGATLEEERAAQPAADAPAPSPTYAPPPPPAEAEPAPPPAQGEGRAAAQARGPAADDGLSFDSAADAVAEDEADEVVAVQATGAVEPADRANRAQSPREVEPEEAGRDADEEADVLSRARLLRARGLHREAVNEYEAFLASAGGNGDLDRVWFEAAESYRALGQDDRALQLYRLVAGGDSGYAARARDRIAVLTGQDTRSKAAGQAAPARARPAAAPEAADEYEAIESKE